MPAGEALHVYEDALKQAEIESWMQLRLEYSSSLPLYVNASELPEYPEPPAWVAALLDD